MHLDDAFAAYMCEMNDIGKRIHETTSATPYDCVDNSCQNTCQGGQCVALVTCRCNRGGHHPPGTNCWSKGTSIKVCIFIRANILVLQKITETPAESCKPSCFHILAERPVCGWAGCGLRGSGNSTRLGDGAKQFRVEMFRTPYPIDRYMA